MVDDDGIIYEEEVGPFFSRTRKYSLFIGESHHRVGNEGLLVRTIDVQTGSYVWAEVFEPYLYNGKVPKNNGLAIGFNVENFELN